MASETTNLPVRGLLGIKKAFIPPPLSPPPPPSFFPFNFPARPPSCLRFRRAPPALQPVSPQRYDAASETNASSQSPALIRSTPSPLPQAQPLSSSRLTVGLPLAVTLTMCLAPGRRRRGHAPAANEPPLRPPSFL